MLQISVFSDITSNLVSVVVDGNCAALFLWSIGDRRYDTDNRLLCLHSEMDVVISAVGWLVYDWQHRNMYVNNVMACIQFGHLVPCQLIGIHCNPTNPEFVQVTSCTEVKKIIKDDLA
jgi:hypothetical protein